MGYLLETLGSVIDGIHGRNVSQERLGGADVAGRFITTNVLLSGLKTEPIGGVPMFVPIIRDDLTVQTQKLFIRTLFFPLFFLAIASSVLA